MRFTWLWRIEHALLHVLGPAQLNNAKDEAQHQRERAARPHMTSELLAGGWVRRGEPGRYYIVRTQDAGSR